MAYEEAIQLLRESKKYWARIHPIYKAHDVAIEVLRKQIPNKPIERSSGFASEYVCPCCTMRLISKMNGSWIAGQKYRYCHACGQALDWSEENDRA